MAVEVGLFISLEEMFPVTWFIDLNVKPINFLNNLTSLYKQWNNIDYSPVFRDLASAREETETFIKAPVLSSLSH